LITTSKLGLERDGLGERGTVLFSGSYRILAGNMLMQSSDPKAAQTPEPDDTGSSLSSVRRRVSCRVWSLDSFSLK
jgi:hypothetical protein